MATSRRRAILALGALSALVACGDDDFGTSTPTTPTPTDPGRTREEKGPGEPSIYEEGGVTTRSYLYAPDVHIYSDGTVCYSNGGGLECFRDGSVPPPLDSTTSQR